MSNTPAPNSAPAHSGANMDRIIERNKLTPWLKWGGGGVAVVLLAVAGWAALPRGISVKLADVSTAPVTQGLFLDALVVRSQAAPAGSVLLDATDGGRVEAVMVQDGAALEKDTLLYRLSNPQREQEVLARSSEVAQQLANLSNQRAALASARAAYNRDMSTRKFELSRIEKQRQRNIELAKQGFLSAAALEDIEDSAKQQRVALEQTRQDGLAELQTRELALQEMERAIAGLNKGLAVVRNAADSLAARAPIAGHLTGFKLQVGESVRAGDHLGRIDTPGAFKLTADIDEFYLARFSVGLPATVQVQSKTWNLKVTRIMPQLKDGRFNIELGSVDPAPSGLQAGLSLDCQITLGQSKTSLLLADGAFYGDSGGAWVFVLDADGKAAQRRNVRLGRRAAGNIEVLEGLKEGERVITSSYRNFGQATSLRF